MFAAAVGTDPFYSDPMLSNAEPVMMSVLLWPMHGLPYGMPMTSEITGTLPERALGPPVEVLCRVQCQHSGVS